jgi:hypothetical protein
MSGFVVAVGNSKSKHIVASVCNRRFAASLVTLADEKHRKSFALRTYRNFDVGGNVCNGIFAVGCSQSFGADRYGGNVVPFVCRHGKDVIFAFFHSLCTVDNVACALWYFYVARFRHGGGTTDYQTRYGNQCKQ